MKTSCKKCLLAVYTNGKQTGCEMNRLHKFGKDVKISADKTHFIIDRLCNTCRHIKYKDMYNDYINEIRREVRVKVDLIIPITDVNKDKLILMTSVLNSWNPNCIKLILDAESEHWIVQEIFGKFCNAPFNVIKVFDKLNNAEKIDNVVNYCNGQFYMFIEQDRVPVLDTNLIDCLDKIINDDLERIMGVKPTDGLNFMTINKKIHKMYHGNSGQLIINKIQDLADEENRPDWIREWVKK